MQYHENRLIMQVGAALLYNPVFFSMAFISRRIQDFRIVLI